MKLLRHLLLLEFISLKTINVAVESAFNRLKLIQSTLEPSELVQRTSRDSCDESIAHSRNPSELVEDVTGFEDVLIVDRCISRHLILDKVVHKRRFEPNSLEAE